MEKTELHLDVISSVTAIDLIVEHSSFSKTLVKKIMQAGAVWLSQNGSKSSKRIRRATKLLKKGDIIHLYYDPIIINMSPTPPQLLADESDYSVWNKPAGLFSQGTKYGDHCTILRWAEKNLTPQRNAFIVHRLDRDAQGIILLAHTKQAAASLSKLFSHREIEKTYHANVKGKLTIDKYPFKIDFPIDGKPALSSILAITYDKVKDESLIVISIQTGRKHQIRKHLAQLGYPIIGDRLYNSDTKASSTLKLCSKKLDFICPISHKQKSYIL